MMRFPFNTSYVNYHPVAYPGEPYSPVPGWGMRPLMAGPRVLAVNGYGMDVDINLPIVGKQTLHMPIEPAIQQGVEAAWPSIEVKLKASLDAALSEGKSSMHKDVVAATVTIIAAIGVAAWWLKRR